MFKKELFERFLKEWTSALNNDKEIRFRIQHSDCQIDGKPALSINLSDVNYGFTVYLENGAFNYRASLDPNAALVVELPFTSFKSLLTTEKRILDVLLLDERCLVKFNSELFDHFNGATVIELLVVAQELLDQNEALREQIISM